MLSQKFDGKPDFTCSYCNKVMCDDCKSIAEEYEYLAEQRKFELSRLQDENNELNKKVQQLEKQLLEWKRVATLGYNDVLIGWIESQVRT